MTTPNGTKRIIGFIIMLLPFVVPLFGYELSDVAPIEMARFSEELVAFIGAGVLIWGTIKAKAPLWFVKKKEDK